MKRRVARPPPTAHQGNLRVFSFVASDVGCRLLVVASAVGAGWAADDLPWYGLGFTADPQHKQNIVLTHRRRWGGRNSGEGIY